MTPMRFHPGEYVRDEMEARGWSVETLADKTTMSRAWCEELIAEKRRVTKIVAYCLSKGLGADMTTWLNLQADYDHWIKTAKGKP